MHSCWPERCIAENQAHNLQADPTWGQPTQNARGLTSGVGGARALGAAVAAPGTAGAAQHGNQRGKLVFYHTKAGNGSQRARDHIARHLPALSSNPATTPWPPPCSPDPHHIGRGGQGRRTGRGRWRSVQQRVGAARVDFGHALRRQLVQGNGGAGCAADAGETGGRACVRGAGMQPKADYNPHAHAAEAIGP